MNTVIYRSTKLLECRCDAEVILCLDESVVTASGLPYIEATLTTTTASGVACGNQIYSYYLEYDESQLADPTYSLINADIQGVTCRGCLTSYIDSYITNQTELITVFDDGDTTPSVKYGAVFVAKNTGATAITNFDNGRIGQEIVVRLDGQTTIVNNGLIIKCKGGINIVGTATTDIVTFRKIAAPLEIALWYEVSRSF